MLKNPVDPENPGQKFIECGIKIVSLDNNGFSMFNKRIFNVSVLVRIVYILLVIIIPLLNGGGL